MARNYADLIAWQRAVDLVVATYGLTASWPQDEVFGLIAQARRAAVSIASHIAEGEGRGSKRERLNYGAVGRRAEIMQLAGEVGRLVNGLLKALDR